MLLASLILALRAILIDIYSLRFIKLQRITINISEANYARRANNKSVANNNSEANNARRAKYREANNTK